MIKNITGSCLVACACIAFNLGHNVQFYPSERSGRVDSRKRIKRWRGLESIDAFSMTATHTFEMISFDRVLVHQTLLPNQSSTMSAHECERYRYQGFIVHTKLADSFPWRHEKLSIRRYSVNVSSLKAEGSVACSYILDYI